MRSDAVQDPIFYQPFDLSNIEFRSVPVDEQDPVQNFKRQFEASLAKKRELFTNGIKVENAPPWHSAQVFVTDKPSLPPLQAELLCMPVATSKKKPTGPTHVYFDTDSAPVGIDNRCSACMSHMDFTGN
jgi:hypothetical protein